MDAKNEKAIGNWLLDIESDTLCLPNFQRWGVWKSQNVCQFLKTLILYDKSPVGIFLVLPTNKSAPLFVPRKITDGLEPQPGVCNAFLLDGQQRLSALWNALHDTDEEDYRYYVEFNDQFEIKDIKDRKKDTKVDQRLSQNPTEQYKEHWFPVTLLNPLPDKEIVNDWLRELDLHELKLDNCDSIKNLIVNTRKIFSKKKYGGKIIPHFQLDDATNKKIAINIYETINSNSVKLSDYYLAVAKMEKETGESLYSMADRLIDKVPSIKDLEVDEIGELILKISCILRGKIPSGGNCKNLNFDKVLKNESTIFDGVEWAVKKLNELQIWHRNQLPSVVPLRVLPAIHQHVLKSKLQRADINEIITKYLWHAFLTDRYGNQANSRLKEDCNSLEAFLNGTLKWTRDKSKTNIFNKNTNPHPSTDDIKKAGWPRSVRILARGILLVCCQGGAKTLRDNEPLHTLKDYEGREKHHIFPKSKLSKKMEHCGNYVLNCMLVPEEDNQKYGNDLPGDYIRKLFENLKTPLPQVDVVNRLETHLISKQMAEILVEVTQDAINKNQTTLRGAYNDFIEARASDVETKIKELLG